MMVAEDRQKGEGKISHSNKVSNSCAISLLTGLNLSGVDLTT